MNKKILAASAIFLVLMSVLVFWVWLKGSDSFFCSFFHNPQLEVFSTKTENLDDAEFYLKAPSSYAKNVNTKFKMAQPEKKVLEVLHAKEKSALPNFFDNEAPEILAKKITDNMSEKELLAQCFMFGWAGQSPKTLLSGWVDSGLGSIKIFGWNTSDTKKLSKTIYELQRRALLSKFSIPLFVATDQEGGLVQHVKGFTTKTPGALACGASGIPKDSYNLGYYIGCELRAIGINLNFAPTVDLYSNYKSSVIASRSFGDNPEKVSVLTVFFAKGLQSAGVLSTAKHFPGHGDTELDSHGYLPKIKIDKETFYNREMIPFISCINADVPFIMSGHLNFPLLMPKNQPASFSKKFITELLKNELGFKGLVVTDDMMMHSSLNYAGNFSNAISLALLAGNNIIESSSTPKQNESAIYENIYKMKTDKIFYETVKQSAEQIILQKLKYFKSETHVEILPEFENVQNKFPVHNSQEFFQSFASRSITLVPEISTSYKDGNYAKLYKDEKILFISSYQNFLNLTRGMFSNAYFANFNTASSDAKKFDKIVVCISDSTTQAAFKKLRYKFPKKKYYVISILSPVFLKGIKAETVLAAYSYSDFSFKASLGVLCGEIKPQGTMPLEYFSF